MTKYENQKEQINLITDSISAKAHLISRRIDMRYGIPGGYTESEIKKIAESLISIQKRMSELLMKL